VHSGNGWEYPLFLIVVSVAVAPQAFAVRGVTVKRASTLGSALHQA
jgi:hypothetical protein